MAKLTDKELYGAPDPLPMLAIQFFHDRLRHGPLGKYVWHSRRIPSWTRGIEAVALATLSYALPPEAQLVELGSFLGASAILLAGPRKVRGSGMLHCVDPFDASGDTFSAPIYREILDSGADTQRAWFDRNMRRAGLHDWITVEQGRSEEVVSRWSRRIDLLLMDGDQSSESAHATYAAWIPFLKAGGILALHNARPGYRREGHDGTARVAEAVIAGGEYENVWHAGSLTIATVKHQADDYAFGVGP